MQFSVWCTLFYWETQNIHPKFPRLDSCSLDERDIPESGVSELNSGVLLPIYHIKRLIPLSF